MYKKVLIGIDESEDAMRGANRALEMAKTDKTEVVAFHSVVHRLTEIAPIMGSGDYPSTISYQLHRDQVKAAERALDKVKSMFEKSGAKIETRLIYDKRPGDYIKETVKEEGFDLVILGCNGEHSKMKRILGTVPEGVLNDVPCDVLIIR